MRLRPGLFVSLLILLASRLSDAGVETNRLVVIAHRANHEQWPENSLEAIQAAIAIGADYVELDVRRTKDQRHILSHDASLKRMTGLDRRVNELTLSEIKQLKLIAPSGGTNSVVPTFEEALDVIGTRIGLYLDFKDGDPGKIIAELRRRGLVAQVAVYLSPSQIGTWATLDPGLRFIVSLPETALSADGVARFVEKYPNVILDGDVREYTPELVRSAHEHHSLVWPDIQNPKENPEQWAQALKLGVDGLQTDHPLALIRWLKSIGRR